MAEWSAANPIKLTVGHRGQIEGHRVHFFGVASMAE